MLLILVLWLIIFIFAVATRFIFRVRHCIEECHDKKILATRISSSFVLLTLPISLYHTYEHLSNFVKPKLQSQIIRIIWIVRFPILIYPYLLTNLSLNQVPAYASDSMLSIVFYKHSFYFQAIRELYESYAIYCFMRLDVADVSSIYIML